MSFDFHEPQPMAFVPAPRQPEYVAPLPRRQAPPPAARPREPEVVRVSLPGPDELGITLNAGFELPPPDELGINPK